MKVMLKSRSFLDERESVMYLLDCIKTRIVSLKAIEHETIAPDKGISQNWQEVCQFVRERELSAFSNFFRCCISYISEFEKLANAEKK